MELALSERPDVVITNWRMPKMNGVDTTRRIRGAHPDMVILALSSTGDAAVRDAFLEAGANAVVDKRDMRPIAPVTVFSHDGRALGKHDLVWAVPEDLGPHVQEQ